MRIRSFVAFVCFFVVTIAAAVPAFAATPPAPSLLSPAAGAGTLSPFTISWSAVSDPSGILGYNWQVSTSSSFSTIALQNSTNAGVTQDTVSGLPNGTYFWRVQVVNGAFVKSAWSASRNLNVTGAGAAQPAAPNLGPTKGYSTFHPLEVMSFNWSAVPTAASYVLEFSQDQSFPISTTGKINNIPNATYSFSTPDEGFYFARVRAVDANGISSVPSNVINFTVFYNNPLPPPPAPVMPANGAVLTLPIKVAWTDVANPQPSGYELQIARDSGFAQIEESAPQLNDPSRTELSLTSGQKFWRVRSAQGDSSPTTAAVTAWSATGSFTMNPAPPAPVSLTLTSNPLYSGNTTFVQIQLTGAAPASGAAINLTSSDPNAAPVPATVTMPGNTAWMQFQMQAGPVTSSTPVTITAQLNSGSASVQFNVLPPSLKSFTVNTSSISGGAQTGAIVMLNGQAPAGGASVSLASDSPAAQAPALATVPAGSSSTSVTVQTSQVQANTLATLTASWNGVSAQSQLTVLPQAQPASITLNPASTSGQSGSFAVVTLASPSSTDQIFQMSSSNPAVASLSSQVLIPAGSTTGGVSIQTQPVSTQTPVTISVSGGGVTRAATLTLNPVAAPTTLSLEVTAGGRSGERIVSSPAGLSVPTGTSATAQFQPKSVMTLSVASGRDAIWSGACSSNGAKAKTCTFTLTANSIVTANVQ
ncbi:MAG TPA: hypothetical protein VKL99_15205 [Candidatus Angelobacter sp.]|nr:hypothetical protein [Candidatus Angelobacter sp.]